MSSADNIDFAALMAEVARRLLGEPTSVDNGGNTWRYRGKGSLAVHVGGDRAGTFKDWESGDSGGVLKLIKKQKDCDRAAAMAWLEREGRIPAKSDRRRTGAPPSNRTRTAQKPAKPRSTTSTSTPVHKEEDPQAIAYAGQLWDAGVRADDTPGRVYLSRRWIWPGVDLAGSPNLPFETVRWLSRQAAHQVPVPQTEQPLKLPGDADGALLFAFTDAAGNVVAVQVEALTAAGKRTRKRLRPNRGRMEEVMRLSPRGSRQPLLVLIEGPVDALAAIWLYPGAVAWCCGGRLKPPADLPDGYAVLIEADGDGSGRTAAAEVRDALELKGVPVRVNWRTQGDLAEGWADTVRYERIERAALLEIDGELTREEAEAAAAEAWPPSRLWAPWIAGEGVPFFNQVTLNVEKGPEK